MNLKNFKKRLAKYDWYYLSSYDYRRFEKGLAEEKALKKIMQGKKRMKEHTIPNSKNIFHE